MHKAAPCDAVTMEPWEIEHAVIVGGKRIIANLKRGNALHYKDQFMESDWEAQPAAVLCEAAVAKFLGKYYDWSAWDSTSHDEFRSSPDLDGIEVRRMRTRPAAAVRARDVAKGVYIWPTFVDMDHPGIVYVFGGASAQYCWDNGTYASYDATDQTKTFHPRILAGAHV